MSTREAPISPGLGPLPVVTVRGASGSRFGFALLLWLPALVGFFFAVVVRLDLAAVVFRAGRLLPLDCFFLLAIAEIAFLIR
ncbi:MAG: hypothetical protein IT430_18585 [Phycisphaerales bacterium]|nr:hypothetical protein [Phycisphaerales bacterium]